MTLLPVVVVLSVAVPAGLLVALLAGRYVAEGTRNSGGSSSNSSSGSSSSNSNSSNNSVIGASVEQDGNPPNPALRRVNDADVARATQFLCVASVACVFVTLLALAVSSDRQMQNQRLDRFPIYYRGLGLVVYGVWAWGLNLHGFAAHGINTNACLGIDGKAAASQTPRLIYFVAAILTLLYCSNFFLYTITTGLIPLATLPMVLFGLFFILLFLPSHGFFWDLRLVFLKSALRIITAPLSFVYFADILLADVFTSFARVFADMATPICLMLMTPDFEFHPQMHQQCSSSLIVPLVLGLPSVWRLFQCLRQYRDEDRQHRHLLNALKYSTVFPVILLSTLQRTLPQYSSALTGWWLLSALINSGYSFYWDIVYDWDLGHRTSNPATYLLRDHLIFREEKQKPALYYGAAIVDLILRLSWGLRFSSIKLNDDLLLFLFEILEVSRRCVWTFLRVEYQVLKDQATTSKSVRASYEMDSDDDLQDKRAAVPR